MTAPGTANDSIREAIFTAAPVRSLGLDDHLADVDPDRAGTSCASSRAGSRPRRSPRPSAFGNMLMLPSPSRWTIVPPKAACWRSSADQ